MRLLSLVLTACTGYLLHVTAYPSGCAMYACDPVFTRDSWLDIPRNATPKVQWKNESFSVPPNVGCSSNGKVVTCMARTTGTQRKNYAVQIDGLTGEVQWSNDLINTANVPEFFTAGNFALFDSNRLAMFDHRGHMTWMREFGEWDSGGRVYSSTIGTNQLIVVTFNVGHIGSWLTDGVPDAAWWFNATIGGVDGIFELEGTPVSDANRFYFVSRFRPDSKYGFQGATNLGRLWAVETHTTLWDRITIAWHYDYTLPAPLTKPNAEMLTQHINGNVYFIGLPLGSSFVAQLEQSTSAQETLAAFASLSEAPHAKDALSNLLVLKDNIDSASLSKSIALPRPLLAFAIDPRGEKDGLWLFFEQASVIHFYNGTTATKVSEFDLARPLQAQIVLTSLPTLARTDGAGEDKDIVLLVAGTVSGSKNQLIALNLSAGPTARPIWVAASPANRPITGQISLVGDGEGGGFCVAVTTELGVYCLG